MLSSDRRCCRRRSRTSRDERGVSLLELVIATSLLVIALGSFVRGLSSTQRMASFASTRQVTLDELRLTADRFAKDVRRATRVTEDPTSTRFAFEVEHHGRQVPVVYEVVDEAGVPTLRRSFGDGEKVVVSHLVDRNVFTPNSDHAADVCEVAISLATQPHPSHPAVEIHASANLRNTAG